jgi:hypothetical protein
MKKKPLPKWLRSIPETQRALAVANLKVGVKTLRRLEKGYEGSAGYDLRKITRLSPAKIARLRSKISTVNAELSRPHVEYRPQSKQARAALSIYTGKKLTVRTKKVIVHTDGRATNLHVRRGVVQTTRESRNADGSKHVSVQRDHYFLFKRAPRSWDEVMTRAADIADGLANGYYMVMTSNHGMIGVPTHRDSLLETLESWYVKYGETGNKTGMAETIIGFRWVGSNHGQSDKFVARYRDKIADIQATQRKRKDKIRRRVRKLLNRRRK